MCMLGEQPSLNQRAGCDLLQGDGGNDRRMRKLPKGKTAKERGSKMLADEQHWRGTSRRSPLMWKRKRSNSINDERMIWHLQGPAIPCRLRIVEKTLEEATNEDQTEASVPVRLVKLVSCASLPGESRFLFLFWCSECPHIVFYLPHISKLSCVFDVTACIQRCADIRVYFHQVAAVLQVRF